MVGLGAALLCGGCGSGNANFVWGRTPALTPDGKTLYFCQNLSSPTDRLTTTVSVLDTGWIFTANADGTNAVQLTPRGLGPDFFPTVSPDGTRLAFISLSNKEFDVWISALDGTARQQVTYDLAVETMPHWRPNGAQIVFVSSRSGNANIWLINSDGTGLQPVTATASDQAGPAYSPDGTQIAYVTNQDRSNWDLWVMNADGSNQRQLTRKNDSNSTISDGGPAWSPDGKTIAFERWTGTWNVYTISAGSTTNNPVQLTNGTKWHSGEPTFTPDGTAIDYTSSESGWWQIWQMKPDGTLQHQLTGQH
jgi:Tol biopolymer transport system component